ncbi:hypothetical protein GCM10023205_59900 [Yinghuangia aomiensis]|uniref:DUF397 domain-containing protein n=1 Tax=Yinghuangia aomiensis TaxID=676205 RepID=A0ABP9HYZ5_9ACTN
MRVVQPAGWRKSSYSNATGGNCVEVARSWRTSSYSNGTGGNCVEVADAWRKSSHSGGNGGECVEVNMVADTLVPVRDSKDTTRGHLLIPSTSWASLTGALK